MNISPILDPRNIGKHYLVDSISCINSKFNNIGIKRHYTNASSMKASIYENILKLG